MNFGVDLSAVASPGTILYTEYLVPALERQLRAGEKLTLYVSKQARTMIASLQPNVRVKEIPSWVSGTKSRLIWGQFHLPGAWKLDGVEVAFAPFDISPLSASIPTVVGVRNPMPLRSSSAQSEEASHPLRHRVHQFLTNAAVKRAVFASYPSAFAARHLGPLQAVPPEKRRVVHHGLDADFWMTPSQSSDQKPEPYFLHVSQFYSYKNPLLAVESFLRYRQQNPESRMKLIFTGDPTATPTGRETVALADRSDLREDIHFTGLVTRDRLRELYQGAIALLMLTSLETFGHPFVEAMAAGCPVVRLATEFGDELCGDASVVCDAADIDSVSMAMQRIVAEPGVRTRIVQSARQRARTFSWDREAAETLALLREAHSAAR